MDSLLVQLIILTAVIHIVDTLSYSVRLNSVKSGKFSLSLSLFNSFVLLSRTANMLQAPLIGSLVGLHIARNEDPITEISWVLLAATTGTLLGILLIPTFLKIFAAAVNKLEVKGSVPSILWKH
ncbi:DUF2837 family protein [Bacillus sp. CECT 9360]|uniref:lipid II flippase family protein n=1 Tax=Bacillus sp. CECT 9360 TaxID=2845821 RepID=UPI001EF9BE37|nr:DUF2837 family protein [Bacillus sp. CECT 9360]CAH0344353.1 Lipid II flippase Amj [Bacillus sp. CECT 9360]